MTPGLLLTILVIGLAIFGLILYLSYSSAEDKKKWRQELIMNRGASQNGSIQNNTIAADKKKSQAKNQDTFNKKLKNMQAKASVTADMSPKSIPYMLIQAGLTTSVAKYWMYALISGGAFFILSSLMVQDNNVVVGLLTITGLFGFPHFVLKRKVAKRQKSILSELPDCLEGMVRLLKSGMPISEAIAMTSREYSGPIGQEMTKVYEAQRVGETLPEAVEQLAFRVPLPEVKMFATAITIQVKTGSSLSEVLQNLARVIRERFKLQRKVKALSAEAKISAAIIGALPVCVMTGMAFINPDYVHVLWSTEDGRFLLYCCLGWMGIGVLVMRQMINFRI